MQKSFFKTDEATKISLESSTKLHNWNKVYAKNPLKMRRKICRTHI